MNSMSEMCVICLEEVSSSVEKFKCCNAYRHPTCLAQLVDHFFYSDVQENIGKIPSCPHCRTLMSDGTSFVDGCNSNFQHQARWFHMMEGIDMMDSAGTEISFINAPVQTSVDDDSWDGITLHPNEADYIELFPEEFIENSSGTNAQIDGDNDFIHETEDLNIIFQTIPTANLTISDGRILSVEWEE
jgi:hypothetical protein